MDRPTREARRRRVDARSVAVVRIVVGLGLAWSMSRYLWRGWVTTQLTAPEFHVTYPGLWWVRPLPAPWMHLVLVVTAIAGFGAGTRLAAAVVGRAGAPRVRLGRVGRCGHVPQPLRARHADAGPVRRPADERRMVARPAGGTSWSSNRRTRCRGDRRGRRRLGDAGPARRGLRVRGTGQGPGRLARPRSASDHVAGSPNRRPTGRWSVHQSVGGPRPVVGGSFLRPARGPGPAVEAHPGGGVRGGGGVPRRHRTALPRASGCSRG